MAGFDLGGVASWIVAAALGLGILWAIGEGMLNPVYSLGDIPVPLDNIGLLIFLAAIALGGFYFLTDVLSKV
jgi:hypothetical protein